MINLETIRKEITRIGCSYAAAGPVECLCVEETDDGRVRIYDDQESLSLPPDAMLRALRQVPDLAGNTAAWEALAR